MPTSVAPFASGPQGPSSSSVVCWTRVLLVLFRTVIFKLKRVWLATQVSHRGKYSIERLIALDEYTRSSSVIRVVLVCLGTPLPLIILVILQESLPLESPKGGWPANWGFWIRAAILAGTTSHGIAVQLNYLMQGINVSLCQFASQFLFMALSYTAASILVASLWVFPIPFMVVVMTPPFFLLMVGSMRSILGASTIRSILENQAQLQRFTIAVSIQVLMAVMYPAYQVLFKSVSGSMYELPAFLLLPVIKMVLKNLVSFCLSDIADLIPENIIFTVHFFNAIYLATSMQSSSSPVAVAVVMIIDLAGTGITLNGIYRSATNIMKHLHQTIGSNTAEGIVVAACSLCHSHEKFTEEERTQVQVHSFFPHQLSAAGRNTLNNLDNCPVKPGPRSSNTQSMPSMQSIPSAAADLARFRVLFSQQWGAMIHPVVPSKPILTKLVNGKHSPSIDIVAAVPSVQHIASLRKTLATLFTIECIVLAEYVEFIIPLLYSNYIVMMVHFPSARYHTELDGVTEANVSSTVRTVFVYGLLELGSFVMFVFIIKKSCGIQALYHLAFVLETQMLSIQSKIMGWMLITLGFRVVHFGTFIAFCCSSGRTAHQHPPALCVCRDRLHIPICLDWRSERIAKLRSLSVSGKSSRLRQNVYIGTTGPPEIKRIHTRVVCRSAGDNGKRPGGLLLESSDCQNYQKRLLSGLRPTKYPTMTVTPLPTETDRTRSRNYSFVATAAGKRLRPWAINLKKIWFAMQISHRGKYSIERMMALDEYTRTTSMLRVLLVLVTTPLPMIVLVLLVEMIPLQDSSDGWRANYGVWIRTAIQAGTVALAAANQARHLLHGVQFSVLQLIALFTSVGLSYTGTAMLAAAFLGFPIPFMAITMSAAFITLLIASFRVVTGAKVFRDILAQRTQLYAFVGFLAAQMLLLLVYPFYQVLFHAASTKVGYQLAVLLLLPLIKSAMKNLVSLTIARMEDLVPEAVIFTVDFFNAVYLATSMQNATSTVTIATIMTVDVVHTAIALQDLSRRTDTIMERLKEVTGVSPTHKNVLDTALTLCRRTNTFTQQKRTYIRLTSCLPHELSAPSRALLYELQQHSNNSLISSHPLLPSTANASSGSVRTRLSQALQSLPATIKAACSSFASVRPAAAVLPPSLPPPDALSEPLSDALSESLRLLFTTECHVLSEYLEAAMPLLYGVFLLAMAQLPNAKFHSELEGVDARNVQRRVQSIFAYAALELLSLAGLALLLRQRGGFRALHQAAFALETQRSLVQAKLLLWMLMAMGFRVVHFGADFSFRFKWLHDDRT